MSKKNSSKPWDAVSSPKKKFSAFANFDSYVCVGGQTFDQLMVDLSYKSLSLFLCLNFSHSITLSSLITQAGNFVQRVSGKTDDAKKTKIAVVRGNNNHAFFFLNHGGNLSEKLNPCPLSFIFLSESCNLLNTSCFIFNMGLQLQVT